MTLARKNRPELSPNTFAHFRTPQQTASGALYLVAMTDFADISRLISYDPETGYLHWKVRRGPRVAGSEAGCSDKEGYRVITVNGRRHYAHRIAWLLQYGEWPSNEVDHISGDRSDNRLSNLRAATRAQNRRNSASFGASGVKGVFWVADQKKWRASIHIDRKCRNLGVFPRIEEAVAAYNSAARANFGEFAKLSVAPSAAPHGEKA